VEALRRRVMGALATLVDEMWPKGVSSPPTYEAYRDYVTGLPLVGQGDLEGAIGRFLRASAADTTFEWPLIQATRLMFESGDLRQADSMIAVLSEIQDRLRTPELRMLNYLEARISGDHATALSSLQEAAEIAPLSESTWELGVQYLRMNRPAEAIGVFEQLDPTAGFLKTWWRYWYYRCMAYHMLGDHLTELQLAGQARLQYADNLGVLATEIVALVARARLEQVNPRLEEAVALTSQAQQRTQMVATLLETALELRAHGHAQLADSVIERIFTWEESRPEGEATGVEDRIYLAAALYMAGQLVVARDSLEALARQEPSNVNVQGYLGVVAVRQGDMAEATRVYEWLQAVEDPYVLGVNTLWQARIAALNGEPERALAHLSDAFDAGLNHVGTGLNRWASRTSGAWLHRDIDFESLREHPAFQELVKPIGELPRTGLR
jgi:tetratricopeptide (TPR) repeat protein